MAGSIGRLHRWRATALGGLALAALAAPAAGHGIDRRECAEGADFVANAARSRDYGLSARELLDRFDGDVATVSGMAPQARWFVHDADDVRLLREAIVEVFERPLKPERHHETFHARCLARLRAMDDT